MCPAKFQWHYLVIHSSLHWSHPKMHPFTPANFLVHASTVTKKCLHGAVDHELTIIYVWQVIRKPEKQDSSRNSFIVELVNQAHCRLRGSTEKRSNRDLSHRNLMNWQNMMFYSPIKTKWNSALAAQLPATADWHFLSRPSLMLELECGSWCFMEVIPIKLKYSECSCGEWNSWEYP